MEVVAGQLEDQVPRLLKFRAEHPEIVITPPGPATMLWKAVRDGELLAEAFWLEWLMNKLEACVGDDRQ